MDIYRLDKIIEEYGKPIFDDPNILGYISSQFKENDNSDGIEFNPSDERDAKLIFRLIEIILTRLRKDKDGNDDIPEAPSIRVNADDFTTVELIDEWEEQKELGALLAEVKVLRKFIIEWYESKGEGLPKKLRKFEWQGAVKGFRARASKDAERIEDEVIKEEYNGSIWALADDMRDKKAKGKFDTIRQAYRYGAKHYTIKGKAVTAIQLETNYHKAKSDKYVE